MMSNQENAAASIIGLTTECVITGLYSAGECRALPTDSHVREAMREEARACGKNMMEEKQSEAGAVEKLVEALEKCKFAAKDIQSYLESEGGEAHTLAEQIEAMAEAALTPFQQKR